VTRLRFGVVPEVVIACGILAACAFFASCLSGCGASAVQTHARAATIAAVATQGAARAVADGAARDAVDSCPDTADDDADRACVAAARVRWAPADAAIGTTRAALLAWVEALDVARLAGDGADLWAPLGLAAARLLAEYARLSAVLAPLGVEMPALPPLVLSLVGGAP
jgi:hypothetical protein